MGKDAGERNVLVEGQCAGGRVEVDVVELVVGMGVDDAEVALLHKVVGDDEMFAVGGELEEVGADDGLGDGGVVDALDGVKITGGRKRG